MKDKAKYVCKYINTSYYYNMWMIGAQKHIRDDFIKNIAEVKKVKDAIIKLSKPIKKQIILYRGTTYFMYPGMLNIDVKKRRKIKQADNSFLEEFRKGTPILIKSALSTSTNRSVGEYYRKGPYGKNTGTYLHIIKVLKGVKVLDVKLIYKKCYPKFPKGPQVEYKGKDVYEDEVILPPDTILYPMYRRGNIFYWELKK